MKGKYMHYVIIADGDFLPLALLQQIIKNKKVMALDGAADKLAILNIKPDIILGDMDAINKSAWDIQQVSPTERAPYCTKNNVLIVEALDQSETDLVKGIRYCDAHNATSITIICATGGRLDHHEGAMRALRKCYQPNRPLVIHTALQSIIFVRDETILIQGKVGDKLGILAYPAGTFTSHGLRYEGKGYPLTFALSESICNELRLATAEIEIKGEALLILPLFSVGD